MDVGRLAVRLASPWRRQGSLGQGSARAPYSIWAVTGDYL